MAENAEVQASHLDWVQDYLVLPDKHASKLVFIKRDQITRLTINPMNRSMQVYANGTETTVEEIDVPFMLHKLNDRPFEQDIVNDAFHALAELERNAMQTANKELQKHLLGVVFHEDEDSEDQATDSTS